MVVNTKKPHRQEGLSQGGNSKKSGLANALDQPVSRIDYLSVDLGILFDVEMIDAILRVLYRR